MSQRQKDLDYCKERALEYLDKNSQHYNLTSAIASMMSDLTKFDTLKHLIETATMLMHTIDSTNEHSVRNFIEDFN